MISAKKTWEYEASKAWVDITWRCSSVQQGLSVLPQCGPQGTSGFYEPNKNINYLHQLTSINYQGTSGFY